MRDFENGDLVVSLRACRLGIITDVNYGSHCMIHWCALGVAEMAFLRDLRIVECK